MGSTARTKVLIKATLLLLFIVTTVVVVRFTPAREYLIAERFHFLPGTLPATLGAAVFGPYVGFICVWLGVMSGSSLAFFIGRHLG